MPNKLRIATTCGILLAVTLLLAGCARIKEITGCYDVGNVEWCKISGSVERKNNLILLHDSADKTEMWGNVDLGNLDCVFVLEFDRGMSDSSVGLEYWHRMLGEYSITFRGGAIGVVREGEVVKAKKVETYVGKPIEVHLKASKARLFVAIDDVTLIDEQNTYWKDQALLKPRLNADTDDTITLYSSFCATK